MAILDCLLDLMKEADASDLHLRCGLRPRLRVRGELMEIPGSSIPDAKEVEGVLREILTEEQSHVLDEQGEIDFAYGRMGSGRFRCNFFREHAGLAAVCRRLPAAIPTLKDLHLPSRLESFAHLRSGLVLVTGPTGSGKTSTAAALLDAVNAQYRKHIVTLEDPIEYLHANRKSVVHQRGLHYDILSFPDGIRDALREDPDVLLIGEMREIETLRLALAGAEEGCLVFASLHTNGAPESIDRIIDVFPADEQPQVRAVVAQSLAGVVSQVLLRRTDGPGRLPATEVLIASPAVANLIRENKIAEVINVMQAGKAQGMHTLDDSLMDLVERKRVSPDEALSYARNKGAFEPLVPHALS